MPQKNGARLKVDKSGRIVVPKRLRDHLGIQAKAEPERRPNRVGYLCALLIEDPALVKVDGLWVHRGSVRPEADWEHVIQDIRDERIA